MVSLLYCRVLSAISACARVAFRVLSLFGPFRVMHSTEHFLLLDVVHYFQ
jgi:hypothetical protein